MSRLLIINVALPRDESIDPPDYKTTGYEVLSALAVDQIPDMLWPRSHQFGAYRRNRPCEIPGGPALVLNGHGRS